MCILLTVILLFYWSKDREKDVILANDPLEFESNHYFSWSKKQFVKLGLHNILYNIQLVSDPFSDMDFLQAIYMWQDNILLTTKSVMQQGLALYNCVKRKV